MKILVFAHKPPPHHGQSVMVGQAVQALGGDVREHMRRNPPPASAASVPEGKAGFECYHVDARLSDDLQQVGSPSVRKVFRLLGYCLEALWCRFRYGVRHLYFVPAHAARSSMARDRMALAICRPFFRTLTYHWQAAGAGAWLETAARPWERRLVRAIMGRPDLSLVLRPHNRDDAEAFGSKRIEIIANGIPDPCPRFDLVTGPRRRRRALARKKLLAGEELGAAERQEAGGDPEVFRVLFLSLCCREKGLFDAVEAVALANRQLGSSAVRIEMDVAGTFSRPEERNGFEARLRQPDLNRSNPLVRYRGFASGPEKERLLGTSDCLCFPTFYGPEACPVALIEALAFGLPVIMTRWRGLNELLPPAYPGLVDTHSPGQIAARMLALLREDHDDSLRRLYLANYTDVVFSQKLRVALAGLTC